MKKLLAVITICMISVASFAQIEMKQKQYNPRDFETLALDSGWQSNIPKECFCCNDKIYNMPNAVSITGPLTICPCNKETYKYSVLKCDGASITWTATDNSGLPVSFTGQGSPTILLQGPFASTINFVNITVEIRCGNKVVKKTIKVSMGPDNGAKFSYQILADGSGGYTVNAQGLGSYASYGNAWRFTSIAPNTLPCTTWGYGTILTTGAYTNLTWTGPLVPGTQYRIIHWIERCSPTWQATPGCLLAKWVCFTITPSTMRMAPGSAPAVAAKGTKIQADFTESEVVEVSADMIKDLRNIKN